MRARATATSHHVVYYTGGDFGLATAVFGRSKAGSRSKYVRRTDYRERTFRKAMEGRSQFYDWSGYREKHRKAAEGPTSKRNSRPPAGSRAITTKLSEVTAKPVDWLWSRWIPLGTLTLLEGDGGLAKSLIATHLAACVTAGGCLPGGGECPVRGVVIYVAFAPGRTGPGSTRTSSSC
jgi:hypothetical protein